MWGNVIFLDAIGDKEFKYLVNISEYNSINPSVCHALKNINIYRNVDFMISHDNGYIIT